MTNKTPSFIPYYRVSTDRQGRSGLGLDAQRAAAHSYTSGRGPILTEYTEIESGRKIDRPELAKALAECRRRKAVLVIARLDRLARNVHFISGLMESGVEFIACDMPHANRLTLHILAAVAEHERELISQRTREALAAAKARGQKLGSPNPLPALAQARAVSQANAHRFADTVRPLVQRLHDQGESLNGIARELNQRDIPTSRGRQWHAIQIKNLLEPPKQ